MEQNTTELPESQLAHKHICDSCGYTGYQFKAVDNGNMYPDFVCPSCQADEEFREMDVEEEIDEAIEDGEICGGCWESWETCSCDGKEEDGESE